MEFFEIQTENKGLRILHKVLLATGILALLYLLLQWLESHSNGKKPSSSSR